MNHLEPSGFTADLPIFAYRDAILASVEANQVTIITAETGAGKSTQVPQYLAASGFRKVIVTQPRILAARTLSARVREEVSQRTGRGWPEYVAYRTSYERDDTDDTVILYCTDGLQLVREITGSGTGEHQILLLDEIHEWNENMEVLIAWAKMRCQEDPRFKVVIMSATIEANNLAAYFGAGTPITVPGRTHEVTRRHGEDLLDEVEQQLKLGGKNVLVFLPGKAEIETAAHYLEKIAGPRGIPVIPLHSQLEAADQQRAFESYPAGKVILSTNIAQTSVTIEDVDVVIDSGLQRQSEVRTGVEGLFIAEISQADCLQRAGRAGRTKPGEYILASFERMPCADFKSRPPYGAPEILRKHLDRLVLRLANVQMDIESLQFYHAPSKRVLKLAKQKLVNLGALTPQGAITEIGRQMERFPVESSYSRMLVEAKQYGPELQAAVAAVIAIQEVGGIVKAGSRFNGWRQFSRQSESDLLAQYEVYLALTGIDPEEWEELGIVARSVSKAQEVLERLSTDLGIDTGNLVPLQGDESLRVRRCIAAGQIDQLWLAEAGRAVHLVSKQSRELSGGTVVFRPALVVGTPFDLEIPTPKGLEVLSLIQDVTMVDPAWLQDYAPHLFKAQPGKIYFDQRLGGLATSWAIKVLGGDMVEGVAVPVLERTDTNYRLFRELYVQWLHGRLEAERRTLQKEVGRRIESIAPGVVAKRVGAAMGQVLSQAELDRRQLFELAKLAKLSTYLGAEFMEKLERAGRRGRFRGGPGQKGRAPRGRRRS